MVQAMVRGFPVGLALVSLVAWAAPKRELTLFPESVVRFADEPTALASRSQSQPPFEPVTGTPAPGEAGAPGLAGPSELASPTPPPSPTPAPGSQAAPTALPAAVGPPARAAILLSGTTVLIGDTPCFALVPHTPFAYGAFQLGADCATLTGRSNAFSLAVLGEAAFRATGGKAKVRPGGLARMRHTFELSRRPGRRVASVASVSYKVYPRESRRAQVRFAKPGYNPFAIQRWADVLESNVSLGVVGFLPFREAPEGMALRLEYLETLPLGARRVGGLAETASTQFKRIELAGRFDFGGFIAGGGIGYAVLTFDGVRAGFVLPTVDFGFLL